MIGNMDSVKSTEIVKYMIQFQSQGQTFQKALICIPFVCLSGKCVDRLCQDEHQQGINTQQEVMFVLVKDEKLMTVGILPKQIPLYQLIS